MENKLQKLRDKYPNKVAIYIGYQPKLAKIAYAASDYFLMPSLFEPCGISQMIASKYGSVPVVREVGGLKDTIKDFGCESGGNGYTFSSVSSKDFEYSVRRAIKDYSNTSDWENKVKTVMNMDFSWRRSMNNYLKVYKEI